MLRCGIFAQSLVVAVFCKKETKCNCIHGSVGDREMVGLICRRLNGRRLREPGDHAGRSIAHRRYNTSVALKCDTASKSPRFPASCCNVADLEVQSHIIASVAERSNAGDCKSPGLRPTLVRIQPGAHTLTYIYRYATIIFGNQPWRIPKWPMQ